MNRSSHWPLLSLACSLIAALACDSAQSERLGLDLRFAQLEQAQTAESGLPAEVQSIQVRIERIGDDLLVADSGCMNVIGDDERRERFQMDLAPEVVRVEVFAYGDGACALEAKWYGAAGRVVIKEGEEIEVPIYVTRRGLSLNPIRSHLLQGRAFATATPLLDGRILIIGGFSSLEQDGAGKSAVLQAACDARIYDPGSAELDTKLIPLKHCRGMHRAHRMSDGSVWVIGGAAQATLDPFGASRPILRPSSQELVESIERFDPQGERFELLGADARLARALFAMAAKGDEGLISFGGRSGEIRSRDILGLDLLGSVLNVELLGEGLLEARAGAEAVSLPSGWLVVGGQSPGAAFLEVVDADGFGARALEPELNGADWSLTGHSLTGFVSEDDRALVLVAGGQNSSPATEPRDEALCFDTSAAQTLSIFPVQMVQARAYHAAFVVRSVDGDGPSGLVLAGGLGADGAGRHDMELQSESGISLLGTALEDELSTGSLGIVSAALPDGSILMLGGVDVDESGVISLPAEVQLLSP